MTDPLSVSVSVLAVLGSGISIAKTLNSVISKYRNAPAAILALSNELSDLLLIIQEVRDQNLTPTIATSLSTIFDCAESKLHELDLFVKSVGVLGTNNLTRRRYERLSWAGKNSRKAKEIKEDLQDVKIKIILLLSTSTMSQLKFALRSNVVVQSVRPVNIVDEEKANCSPGRPQVPTRNPKPQSSSNIVGFQIRPQRNVCSDWCSCICHRRYKLRSPHFFDKFFGTLQLGYNSIPMTTPSCSESSCWQEKASTSSLMYYFPRWLVNRAICFAITNSFEPMASLIVPRIIDPQSDIFRFTMDGKFEGVRKLLEERKASPNDMPGYQISRGSVLHLAITFKKLEICKLLIKAGADLYIENSRGQNAIDLAWLDTLATGRWPRLNGGHLNPWKLDELAELTALLSNSSFLHENAFSRLNKPVFQSQPQRLRQELEVSTKDIDHRDGQGCTVLGWAATRLDPECLEIILSYGADPGYSTEEMGTLLCGLASQLDLDASMEKKRRQCLEVAIKYGKARHGQNYVNQCNDSRRTPLMLACIFSQPTAIVVLLEAGADINIANYDDETALSSCLTNFNNESCLEDPLNLILSNPRLNRTLTRRLMLEVLRQVQSNPYGRGLSQLIKAELSCTGLTQNDWKKYKKLLVRHSPRKYVQLSELQPLWKRFISDLKLRAGSQYLAQSTEDCSQDGVSYLEESYSSLEEGGGAAGIKLDDNSSEEDEFEDARSSFDVT